MGLFNALTSAVSGLQAQSFAMQNISGNIANSQTIAYKGIDTNFLDLIPGDSIPSKQIAGGVIANSRATNTVQGTIQTTAVGHRHCHQWQRLFHRAVGGQLHRQHAGFQRHQQLHAARRFQARRQRLPGQRRRLLSRRHSDRPDDRQSVRQRCRAAAISKQLFARQARPRRSAMASTFRRRPTPMLTARARRIPNCSTRPISRVDPTIAGTGTVVGSDVATFVDETIDGGSVTAYDATGTAGQYPVPLGQDGQRRRRRRRHLGTVLSDRLDRDRRHGRLGKMPAQISYSARTANSVPPSPISRSPA